MLKITQEQKENLEKAGLLRHRKTIKGRTIEEPNFYIASKTHKSKAKTYYVVEEYKVLKFLGMLPNKKNKKES